jgi:hypothetical protein
LESCGDLAVGLPRDRFWVSVVGALRQTTPGSALVRPLTAAPDLDGWAVVERLLKDLAPLADRVWLVIDDASIPCWPAQCSTRGGWPKQSRG